MGVSRSRDRGPRALADLTALEQRQLVAAGKAYDGKKLSAAIRLSSDEKHQEVSFFGSLELRDLADAEGAPAYTAFLYRVDSGSIFRAGETGEVAGVTQSSVECADPALRSALIDATRPMKKPVAKKRSAKTAR